MADESSTHPPPAAFYDVHEGNRFDLVGGLAGVLLGAGVVAWQADTFPLGPDPKVCWGSLSADEVPTRTEHSG
jgi:hypothetical protein